jgi:hypothetical protein
MSVSAPKVSFGVLGIQSCSLRVIVDRGPVVLLTEFPVSLFDELVRLFDVLFRLGDGSARGAEKQEYKQRGENGSSQINVVHRNSPYY